MRLPALLLAAALLPLAACNKPAPQEPNKPGEPTVSHEEPAMSSHDPNSYAEPEKVVIAIKSAMLAEPTVKAAPDSAHLKDKEKMLQSALTWCIEQYYGD